ncbi:uncharacterized protein SCHCODRAFT_02712004, partial [Schizophyllum commune H4-8]|uniref:uncharacterized protein n=1 Tax=Schizophyllum commune (strain H4-8 / FGSC 9210) TaxID=578458 RepID=UPI00215EAF38
VRIPRPGRRTGGFVRRWRCRGPIPRVADDVGLYWRRPRGIILGRDLWRIYLCSRTFTSHCTSASLLVIVIVTRTPSHVEFISACTGSRVGRRTRRLVMGARRVEVRALACCGRPIPPASLAVQTLPPMATALSATVLEVHSSARGLWCICRRMLSLSDHAFCHSSASSAPVPSSQLCVSAPVMIFTALPPAHLFIPVTALHVCTCLHPSQLCVLAPVYPRRSLLG